MMNNDGTGGAAGTTVIGQACFLPARADVALESALFAVYPDGCDVSTGRWLSNLDDKVAPVTSNDSGLRDCPVAAVVYVKVTRSVLAVATYVDDINEDDLKSVRRYCADRAIRLFPVERLESYSAELLNRVAECEQIGLDPNLYPHFIPEARCPNCGGPLIHKTKRPTKKRNGLFYACAQHYPGHYGAVNCTHGYICGADEIFGHLDPDYRDLKYRLKDDFNEATKESDWA